METSRVTTKGQVTIPQKIRERFDIHAGDVLAFVSAEDGTLRVQKPPPPLSTERVSYTGPHANVCKISRAVKSPPRDRKGSFSADP